MLLAAEKVKVFSVAIWVQNEKSRFQSICRNISPRQENGNLPSKVCQSGQHRKRIDDHIPNSLLDGSGGAAIITATHETVHGNRSVGKETCKGKRDKALQWDCCSVSCRSCKV